jgi:hypothetical protein
MNATKRFVVGLAGLAVASLTTWTAQADNTNTVTLRTTGYFVSLTQGSNAVTGDPIYENVSFAGHNLVNLAMGRDLTDTNFPHQVLAMTFECDMSAASLVVYDLAASNTVAVIASSSTIDAVYQQDLNAAGPNRAHFVAMLLFGQNGNDTNGITGGYATVAGRVHLNPVTGCPQPVPVLLDRDSLDKAVDDMELPESLDPDSVPLTLRTGLAHLIGDLKATTDSNGHTILIPYGGLSIRRELPGEPVTITPATN